LNRAHPVNGLTGQDDAGLDAELVELVPGLPDKFTTMGQEKDVLIDGAMNNRAGDDRLAASSWGHQNQILLRRLLDP
jgi:hypothetical protein